MTMTPGPTDKLDAAASRGERTRGRDQRMAVISADLHGLLEPDAGRLARPVLRGAERREALGLPEYARHDQRLGGESPLWRLMAPTTSQWQLRRREAGWEGSRRRNRDPRNTWRIRIVCGRVGCAYEAGRSGRAGSAWRSPMSIKGPSRRRGGCAGKAVGLIRGGLHGSPRCPSAPFGAFVGWCGTVGAVRLRLAVEKSAEAVLPAGIVAGGWEGPNAKPSVRTFVLVVVALTAANPSGGLVGSV